MVDLPRLEKHAKNIRKNIIDMLAAAGSGHTAGSLGLVEILTALYGEILTDKDLFMLSNGHVAPVQYATLAEFGKIPKGELATLRKFGSKLQGHPERVAMPELIQTTSGPLGEGIGQAAGMALAIQKREEQYKRFVYVVVGDGEMQEGNVWESLMFGAKYKLGNLILIIDRNEIQISGSTEEVMPLENLQAKCESFGWHVAEIDGNNMESFIGAVGTAKIVTDRPTAILAHTVPGKGVSDIEGDYKWHGKAPSKEEATKWKAKV
ncbi:transketolase [Candidatus Saccharibacteria bacterium]|nr:transketolase [Candidatus Saccharibacteria bacterium]